MIDSYLELIVNASEETGAKRTKNKEVEEVIIESGSAGKGDKASAMKQARE